MKLHLKILSVLCAVGVLTGVITFGNEEAPPKLIQELLKKEGATLAELKGDPELRERLRQQLYQKGGKPLQQQRHLRPRRRSSVKLPPYYQVIIDNNLFRPLGYRKTQWTLKLELVGTVLYTDEDKNAAILRSNHPKHRYAVVRVGDTFLERTITRIEARSVSYITKEGAQEQLNLPSLFGGETRKPRTETKS